MDWIWLLLGVVGLALLWLVIMWMEKLAERLKVHDEERKLTTADIAKRTAEAEAKFLEEQAIKENAKDIVAHAQIDQNDPEQVKMFIDAVDQLSTEELVQAATTRAFGAPQELDEFTAKQSAFDQLNPKKVVAKGDGITPVKVKPAGNSALSKSEQKMLKKIKQGD